MWLPRGWQWQLGPKCSPESERAARAKAHHALGSCPDPRPAFLSGPKPRCRNKLRPALLTPGVPSPPVSLLSYIRPVSPLSSGRSPHGWGSRGAASVPVREPRAAENHRKSLLQASALAEPSCPVGGFCRSSTAIASLLGSGPSPLPSPPCRHSGSR